MKLKNYLPMLGLGLAALTMYSCDNDDDNINVPSELNNALSERYPNAQRIEWETERNYYVADFWDGYERSAWFTVGGEWQMTETDLPYRDFPQAVKTAFESSNYANWRMDDTDQLERKDLEVVYIIEVEQNQQEADLYYTADGILIREWNNNGGNNGSGDNSGGYQPLQMPAETQAFIESKYPGARIVELDMALVNMQAGYEVDIVHDQRSKDLLFDQEWTWVETSWEIWPNELPQAITGAVSAQYPNTRIDDADYVETPDNTFYRLELEPGEFHIQVMPDGTIL